MLYKVNVGKSLSWRKKSFKHIFSTRQYYSVASAPIKTSHSLTYSIGWGWVIIFVSARTIQQNHTIQKLHLKHWQRQKRKFSCKDGPDIRPSNIRIKSGIRADVCSYIRPDIRPDIWPDIKFNARFLPNIRPTGYPLNGVAPRPDIRIIWYPVYPYIYDVLYRAQCLFSEPNKQPNASRPLPGYVI